MKTVTMNELHARLPQLGKNEVFLDVRTPEEFAEGHIPGSLNVSHMELMGRVGELRKYDKIYIYCRSGARAEFVASLLLSQGFQNLLCVSDGGMPEWIASGFEVAVGR